MRKLSRTHGFTLVELLMVVGIMGIIAVIAAPLVEKTIDSFRIVGTARSVTNAMAVAKIRAASSFTRVRLYVDVAGGSHHLQRLDRSVTPHVWVTDGSLTYLPTGVTFSYGSVGAPPPDSQATIGQAPPCLLDDGVTEIAGTACVMFNSRGVPVNTAGTPVTEDALYVTDGTAVYGVTVAPTGMIRLWRTYPFETPAWVLQ